MTPEMIARAWKDPQFRDSLSSDVRNALPDHPSAAVELPEGMLGSVQGGAEEEITKSGLCEVTELLSCLPNCATVVRGTCGAFSYGCCPG